MIDAGMDVYFVKEFLGHASLQMTERYVKIYLESIKAKYATYREKTHHAHPLAETPLDAVTIAPPGGSADGGWVEGRVGKLYRSPLPGNIGHCEHLPQLDPCPTPPVCATCPKFRALPRHLSAWQKKAEYLRMTLSVLEEQPHYQRAAQRHQQELDQADRIIHTIEEHGFWDGRLHND